MSTQGVEEQKTEPVKKRNRKVASCNPCRALRLRCSRTAPCTGCTDRGTPDKCIWDSNALPPVYNARERNEVEALRKEVDRLQKVVEELQSRNNPLGLTGRPAEPSGATNTASQESSTVEQAPEDVQENDLLSHDLARQLARLSIKTFGVGQQDEDLPTANGPVNLVKEVNVVLDDPSLALSHAGSAAGGNPRPSHATGLFSFSRSRLDVLSLMALLPSRAKADACTQYYYKVLDWYMHPMPYYVFVRHKSNVWAAQAAGVAADPVSLAVCFAVWGMALSMMQTYSAAGNQPCTHVDSNAEAWLDLAAEALSAGHLLDAPTLDSIRALLVLGTYCSLIGTGESGSKGIAYLSLTVQCCFQLQLHRDPDKLSQQFSAAEAEERRRIFWVTYVLHQMAESMYGRSYELLATVGMLRRSEIDCNLPRDVSDGMIGVIDAPYQAETVMTSILHLIKVQQLTEEVSEEIFGIKPVSYAQVLAFDNKLHDIQAQVPAPYCFDMHPTWDVVLQPVRALRCFVIHYAIAHERLRLHRPYLVRSYSDPTFAHSRQECLRTAREMLHIQTSPVCAAPLVSVNYAAVSCCIILLLDCLFAPHGALVAEQRKIVEEAARLLEGYSSISTVIRRGVAIVRFLLTKLDPVSSATHDAQNTLSFSPRVKRIRLSAAPAFEPVVASSELTSAESVGNEREDDSTIKRKLPPSFSLPKTVQELSSFDTGDIDSSTSSSSQSLPPLTTPLVSEGSMAYLSQNFLSIDAAFYRAPLPEPLPHASPPSATLSDGDTTTISEPFEPNFNVDFGNLFGVPPLDTSGGQTVPYAFEGLPDWVLACALSTDDTVGEPSASAYAS